jgi:hypothetical protein
MLRYGYLIRNGQPDCDGKRGMFVAMTYFNLGAFEFSELQHFIDIKSSDIYKICYMRHQIIITNTKYYLN